MFMGEFIHSIDAKGRIIMPSKFRDEVPEGSFVITRGLDGCLFVYTEEEWAAFDSKLQSLPLINKGTRQLNRFFHAGVTELNLISKDECLYLQLLENMLH